MHKKSFTLAETIITLTIVGIIAALTIPNLLRKYSDHADIVRVNEAYSILDNALKMAIADKGPIENWDWPNPKVQYNDNNSSYLAKVLSEHLKVEKICDSYIMGKWENKCFNDLSGYYYNLLGNFASGNGTVTSRRGQMILVNGMRLYINSNTTDGSYNGEFGSITVDINGKKTPNRLGYDVFSFKIGRNGLTKKAIGWWATYDSSSCNITNTAATQLGGISCSYWIYYKGNMDYKYRDVSKEWPRLLYSGND